MRTFREAEGADLRQLVEGLAKRIAALAYRHEHPGSPRGRARAYAHERWAGYVSRAVWALGLLGGCQRAWRAAPRN
jgi:hypothetical protein